MLERFENCRAYETLLNISLTLYRYRVHPPLLFVFGVNSIRRACGPSVIKTIFLIMILTSYEIWDHFLRNWSTMLQNTLVLFSKSGEYLQSWFLVEYETFIRCWYSWQGFYTVWISESSRRLGNVTKQFLWRPHLCAMEPYKIISQISIFEKMYFISLLRN